MKGVQAFLVSVILLSVWQIVNLSVVVKCVFKSLIYIN